MARYARVGYDRIKVESKEELKEMYLTEGHSMSASVEMAGKLHNGMRALVEAEKRSWKETREHEIPFGLLEEPEGG